MRLLFLGGTGIISTACVDLAVTRGHDVHVLNRGHRPARAGAHGHAADLSDEAAAQRALGGSTWDAVVDFLAYTPADVERDLRLFRGKVGQLVLISSASAYQKPVTHPVITESTPLSNPFWQYSRDKIACEERLLAAHREERFPVVVVRPSLTYGDTQIALALNSWERSYTVVDRLRRGLPVIVPGDGSSLWTLTHNTDFAKGLLGLLGNDQALGHAFHITSDELLSWNQVYQQLAEAAGVARPELVRIPSDFIVACLPDEEGNLHGDKSNSMVMDNAKIKRFVPDFVATTRYKDGIRRTLAWFDADPARRLVDDAANQRYDRLVAAYRSGLDAARKAFGRG
jgi:nucleoside-diphosphate-sugar epimerase